MWIITSEMFRGSLEFYVENSETGERKGTFDDQDRAAEFAATLNKGDETC